MAAAPSSHADRFLELSRRPWSAAVQADVEALLAELPPVDSLPDAQSKARNLLLRGQLRLLFPSHIPESEADLNRALKMHPDDPAVWVAMSEALWKRNALVEAREALESALRINPAHQAALSQLSRVTRTLSVNLKEKPEERFALITQSVDLAKRGVAADTSSPDAWSALGVALLHQSVHHGLGYEHLRKGLAALNHAVAKAPWNADAWYNRGVVNRTLGHYSQSFVDFTKAAEIDPTGLPSAAPLAAECRRALLALQSIDVTEKDRRRLTAKLPALGTTQGERSVRGLADVAALAVAAGGVPPPSVLAVTVMTMISSSSDQPLAYAVVDKALSVGVVLVPCVAATAIRTGDLMLLPSPPNTCRIVDQSAIGEEIPAFSCPVVHADPAMLMVNGSPLPTVLLRPATLSSRQFL